MAANVFILIPNLAHRKTHQYPALRGAGWIRPDVWQWSMNDAVDWDMVQMPLSSPSERECQGGEEAAEGGHQLARALPAVAISAAPMDNCNSFIQAPYLCKWACVTSHRAGGVRRQLLMKKNK